MDRNSKKHYTIMFVPHDEAKPFSINVHRNIVRIAAGFVVLLAVTVVFMAIAMGAIGLRLQLVGMLKRQNTELRHENQRLAEALGRADKTAVMGQYLQRLVALSSKEPSAKKLREQLFAVRDGQDATEEGGEQNNANNAKRVQADATRSRKPQPAMVLADRADATPSISPVEGWITKHFRASGSSEHGAHLGMDFAASEGTPIRATAPGSVLERENHRYFGLILSIKHEHGFVTRYGHCSQVLVSKGERVERGQAVALVGNTGRSTAPHLHYEVLQDGVPVDPAQYIFTSATP